MPKTQLQKDIDLAIAQAAPFTLTGFWKDADFDHLKSQLEQAFTAAIKRAKPERYKPHSADHETDKFHRVGYNQALDDYEANLLKEISGTDTRTLQETIETVRRIEEIRGTTQPMIDRETGCAVCHRSFDDIIEDTSEDVLQHIARHKKEGKA